MMMHSSLSLMTISLLLLAACLSCIPTSRSFTNHHQLPVRQQQKQQQRQQSVSTVHWAKEPSKWDNLVDEDEDDDDNNAFFDNQSIKPDMTYESRNVKRAHDTFLSIRAVGGVDMVNDVYCRDPTTDVFWYIGKVAKISDVTLEQCVARQWPLIEHHAIRLRPIELYPHRGTLQLWTAPGDSEMEVACNRPNLKMEQMTKNIKDVDGAEQVKKTLVGFQGEVYGAGVEAFCTWRTEEGLPKQPEIVSPTPDDDDQ